MRKPAIAILVSALIAAPANAASFDDGTAGIRPGSFAGAVIRIPLDGSRANQPRASLTFAPTQTRIGSNGATSTRIGEGFAFNLTPGSKPTLTLAGVRADTAFGIKEGEGLNPDRKLGMSTGGVVAIGVGALALIAGGLYLAADHIADCDEGECN